MHNYICPSCGKQFEIKRSGTFQCTCGREFSFQVKSESPAPESNICPYCKSPLAPGAVKCAHCGEWISESASKSKTTYILLAILFGPIAEFYLGNYILGLAFMFFYYGAATLFAMAAGSGKSDDAGIMGCILVVIIAFYWFNVFFTKVGPEAAAQEAKKKGPSA